jgi:hypothetical protein
VSADDMIPEQCNMHPKSEVTNNAGESVVTDPADYT